MADNTLKYHLEHNVPHPDTIKVVYSQEICQIECQNRECKNTWLVEREDFKTEKMNGGYICQKYGYGKAAQRAKENIPRR